MIIPLPKLIATEGNSLIVQTGEGQRICYTTIPKHDNATLASHRWTFSRGMKVIRSLTNPCQYPGCSAIAIFKYQEEIHPEVWGLPWYYCAEHNPHKESE